MGATEEKKEGWRGKGGHCVRERKSKKKGAGCKRTKRGRRC